MHPSSWDAGCDAFLSHRSTWAWLPALAPDPSFLLVQALGGSGAILGSWVRCGRPGLSSWFLSLTFAGSGSCAHLGTELEDGISISLK